MLVLPEPPTPLVMGSGERNPQTELLMNHIDNSERSNAIERQLRALIDWHLQTAARLRYQQAR